MSLSPQAKEWLLAWARTCIREHVQGHVPNAPHDLPEEVEQPRGCFVSLHEHTGDLRGCIGTFAADSPLWKAVQQMAISCATKDPRFAPLEPKELDNCHVEISALTPLEKSEPADVVVGKHGVCVRRGPVRGVLLPQVATQQGWDRDTFLSQTCVKAHLPPGAWREPDVIVETFSAEVFGEAPREH